MDEPACPHCGFRDCPHFVGWTADGRQIEKKRLWKADPIEYEPLRDTDDVVPVKGKPARVYRGK